MQLSKCCLLICGAGLGLNVALAQGLAPEQEKAAREALEKAMRESAPAKRPPAKSAKSIIQSLIDREHAHDPLSDQRLAEILKAQGLDIARRTVAKYREQLHVPNARFRKRH